ncbi:hypothetical protein QC334_33335 [Streptomyces sp. DH18]|uniref:hypothetical protein n=1 Tax=unclassified Streptomyces TaxID=2593676 RepID=UPI001E5CB77C|nr:MULTISPECIES: hypothetical protein [unclassified Streptomyces]MDG9687558.1 hypothetical protein [Streptomyces sp. DH18]
MHLPTVCHWIITFRWEVAGTSVQRTVEGTVQTEPGQTRQDAYRRLVAAAAEQVGAAEFAVEFFALEPNQM